MPKLAVIHFSPIEIYPPVMNWLQYLRQQSDDSIEVKVYTMQATDSMKPFDTGSAKINIYRFGKSGRPNPFSRQLEYIKFYTRTIQMLIKWKPDSILYYESISSFPALWFSKYVDRKVKLLVHYHEYVSPPEYKKGMILNKWFHLMEKKRYPGFTWISQTNEDRMRLFLADNRNVETVQTHILPNYPPSSWKRKDISETIAEYKVFKFVYVGALSLEDMYLAEFVGWLIKQGQHASLDIYSGNISSGARQYIESLGKEQIRFRGAVDYSELPNVLKEYNVGLILYKGTTPNYVFNAPNKLFEYLACGLDVWFPNLMKSCHLYITNGSYPKVVGLDFESLNSVALSALKNREGLLEQPSGYFAEKVFPDLLKVSLGKTAVTAN